MTTKVDENRLRRAARRLGLSLHKNADADLWFALRFTTHRKLRIVSPAEGLGYDEMVKWLDDRKLRSS
jgi:hypothetical protein